MALEDPLDPVPPRVRIPGEARPGETGARAVGDLVISSLDVGVRDLKLGDHVADQVVQIGAVLDVGQERPVTDAEIVPVVPVEVFDVEEVAEPPPDLVEDLHPFGLGIPVGLESGGGDRFLR